MRVLIRSHPCRKGSSRGLCVQGLWCYIDLIVPRQNAQFFVTALTIIKLYLNDVVTSMLNLHESLDQEPSMQAFLRSLPSAALIDNGQVDEGAAFDGAEDRFGKFHVFHALVES